MAYLASYLDLREEVAERLNNRAVLEDMRRHVLLAEDRLNRELRSRDQVTSDTLTFATGDADLPADFLEMISVFGVNNYPMRAGSMSDIRQGAQYSRYAISAGKIYIHGFTGDRDILYFAALPTLTDSGSATNWLLDRYPDLYLYAVCLEAAKALRDVEQTAVFDRLRMEAMALLRRDDESARWSNATVRVQGMTP